MTGAHSGWSARRRRHDATAKAGATRRASSPLLLGVIVLAAAGLSSCTASAAPHHGSGPGRSSTQPSASTTAPNGSTTTTTVALPTPVPVGGTLAGGSDSFLGLAKRVPIVAIPDGRLTAPVPVPGAPGYVRLEHVAFRRFGSGPDLLLIMGQDGSMAWWQPSLVALLAQHYRVTMFDLPGIGYSQPATEPVTLDWLADETAGLVQALSLSHPTVLGWGLGGDIALALAKRHPASVGALVLVDTSAGGSAARAPAPSTSALFSSRWATPSSLAPSLFTGSTTAGSAWLSALSSGVPDNVTQAGIAEEAELERYIWSGPAFAGGLSAVTVPTLVVYGSEDTVCPVPDGALLVRAIAGAKAAVLPSAGYGSMFEDPSQFVAAVEQFTA